MTTKDLKQSLRDGRYAWPGGYEKFYVTNDGGVLCDPCVRKEWRLVCYATRHMDRSGWAVEGIDATCNVDEEVVICDHCGSTIYDPEE